MIEACLCCEDNPAEDESEYCNVCELEGCTYTRAYCQGEGRQAEVLVLRDDLPVG